MLAVDIDLDVHAVVGEQTTLGAAVVALEARERRGGLQRGGVAALQFRRELARDHLIAGDIGVARGGEGNGGIEKGLGLGDRPCRRGPCCSRGQPRARSCGITSVP